LIYESKYVNNKAVQETKKIKQMVKPSIINRLKVNKQRLLPQMIRENLVNDILKTVKPNLNLNGKTYELTWKFKPSKDWPEYNELERSRESSESYGTSNTLTHNKNGYELQVCETIHDTEIIKYRTREIEKRKGWIKNHFGDNINKKKKKEEEVLEWKVPIARIGTGYRVRLDETNPRRRNFDVGYSDIKTYQIKDGRHATVESSNKGRTLYASGKGCRVRVINAVCSIENRQKVSKYTGSGILRKSRVGRLKLKPTKPVGKT
jgi:hypothetical protein